MRHSLLLLLAVVSFSSCRLLIQEGETATPQRPTFSVNTNTTAHGTLEVETGVLVDPGDLATLPTTIKYGAGPNTEVFLGLSPYNYVDIDNGEDQEGFGDTVLGLRYRLLEGRDQTPSVAIMPFVKLPTANENDSLGTGEMDFSMAAIASMEQSGVGITGYYQFDVLGEVGGGTEIGHGLALALSTSVTDQVGVFGEVASILVPDDDFEPVFATVGGAYTLSPAVAVDASVRVGLNDDAPNTQWQLGITRNFGRVYRAIRPQFE